MSTQQRSITRMSYENFLGDLYAQDIHLRTNIPKAADTSAEECSTQDVAPEEGWDVQEDEENNSKCSFKRTLCLLLGALAVAAAITLPLLYCNQSASDSSEPNTNATAPKNGPGNTAGNTAAVTPLVGGNTKAFPIPQKSPQNNAVDDVGGNGGTENVGHPNVKQAFSDAFDADQFDQLGQDGGVKNQQIKQQNGGKNGGSKENEDIGAFNGNSHGNSDEIQLNADQQRQYNHLMKQAEQDAENDSGPLDFLNDDVGNQGSNAEADAIINGIANGMQNKGNRGNAVHGSEQNKPQDVLRNDGNDQQRPMTKAQKRRQKRQQKHKRKLAAQKKRNKRIVQKMNKMVKKAQQLQKRMQKRMY